MIEILVKNFPLLTQLDNEKNPYGSCNLTCVAMCLTFLKKQRDARYARFEQWEDELQQRAENNGWDRHEPGTMKRIAALYGATDQFAAAEGWVMVGSLMYATIAHLTQGLPAIAHTYLTQSGHIVCLTGVRLDNKGKPIRWHITDPYGEFYPDGYERNYGGDPNLGKYWLSHSTFMRLILTDGAFWVHHVA